MKHFLFHTAFVSLLLSFASCSEENESIQEPVWDDFMGRYEIVSITAEQALDLNNDGIASNDLYHEYMAEFHWPNACYLPLPFDFTNPYNFASFRRNLILHVNLAEFRFPCQYFNDAEYVTEEIPPLRNYNWGMTHMLYELKEDGQVNILPSTIPSDTAEDNMGNISRLQRLNSKTFRVEMTLRIYDFKQCKWVVTPVQAEYERRE